jgi:hypothetical protein
VLQNYDNPINKPVGITCNAGVGAAPISPAQTPNGLPIVDPACNVITSYSRSEPTREIFPTEIFRFQSSSIKNVTMNGNVRYTYANTSLPNYYDNFQGLAGTNRETHVCWQRQRQAGSDRHRLRHHLAGAEKAQHLRADRLLECAPAGSCQHYESNHRDFRNPEHQ